MILIGVDDGEDGFADLFDFDGAHAFDLAQLVEGGGWIEDESVKGGVGKESEGGNFVATGDVCAPKAEAFFEGELGWSERCFDGC